MPPRKSTNTAPSGRISAANINRYVKRRTKINLVLTPLTYWSPGFELLLLEAVSYCHKNAKLVDQMAQNGDSISTIWDHIKRNVNYFSIFKHMDVDIKNKYAEIMKLDGKTWGGFYINTRIVPMLKYQRTLQGNLDFLPVNASTAIQAPFYGPRYGVEESDDEFLTKSNKPVPSPQHTTQPDILKHVENKTISALRFKLSSIQYQSTLMRCRYEYLQKHNITLDPLAIPPVTGIQFVTLPPPPPAIIPYLTLKPQQQPQQQQQIDTLEAQPSPIQLITPDTFFPTVNDEYRFLFQQFHYYYNNRHQPLSFRYHTELYQDLAQTHHELWFEGHDVGNSSPHAPTPFQSNTPLTVEQINLTMNPRYATRLASVKTYLNNVIGMPLWYSVVVANFLYQVQLPRHTANVALPKPIELELDTYLHVLFNVVVQDHFSRFQTSCKEPPKGINLTNAKDRYQQMFVGGGRHCEVVPVGMEKAVKDELGNDYH